MSFVHLSSLAKCWQIQSCVTIYQMLEPSAVSPSLTASVWLHQSQDSAETLLSGHKDPPGGGVRERKEETRRVFRLFVQSSKILKFSKVPHFKIQLLCRNFNTHFNILKESSQKNKAHNSLSPPTGEVSCTNPYFNFHLLHTDMQKQSKELNLV